MNSGHIVALSGGVGGAKLADGLLRVLPPDTLSVIVNTGDDFRHLGLHISPDVDTALYTLGGLANPETGWGRRDETWNFMRALEVLGGETWFRLGDGDLAMHVERSRRLATGDTLSRITADVARHLGIPAQILPMTDAAVRTRLHTARGLMDFQDYFVRNQCQPVVSGISFDGVHGAQASAAVLAALDAAELRAIIICPSNPYLSIDPILALPEIRERLRTSRVPVIAVSPLVGGKAVKGPTTKLMTELGLPQSALEIARHYEELIDGFVLDENDNVPASRFNMPVMIFDTLMSTSSDRERVARETLKFAETIGVTFGIAP